MNTRLVVWGFVAFLAFGMPYASLFGQELTDGSIPGKQRIAKVFSYVARKGHPSSIPDEIANAFGFKSEQVTVAPGFRDTDFAYLVRIDSRLRLVVAGKTQLELWYLYNAENVEIAVFKNSSGARQSVSPETLKTGRMLLNYQATQIK